MLLITGTQRCGTSLTAEFCHACGYEQEGNSDNVGKFESADITLAYRHLLNEPDFPFSDYPAYPDRPLLPLEAIERPVAKFSFLMMDPELVDLWLLHRGNSRDKWLILVREAEKVYRSKNEDPARREQFRKDSDRFRLSPALLKQQWFDSFCRILAHHVPYRILKFPQFIDDYPSLYAVLHDWAGLSAIPRDSRLWKSIVDKTKITAE